MTKKSYARQQRDRALKQGNSILKQNQGRLGWDELKDIYEKISSGIDVSVHHLAKELQDESLYEFFPDKNQAVILIKGLESDIARLRKELSDIYALHKDRTGGFGEDVQDLMKCIEIGENYTSFNTRFSALIIPNITLLSDSIRKAHDAKAVVMKAIAEMNEQNPNVVTDVVAKESSESVAST